MSSKIVNPLKSGNILDGTIIIFVLSWIIMKRKYNKNISSQLKQIDNKYTLFLVILLYILQLYFYCIMLSIFFIMFMQLVKVLLLEQFAKLANGKYLFSVESFSKSVIYLYTSKPHMTFNLMMFLILVTYTFTAIFTMNDDPNENIRKNQMSYILDMVLTIYITLYVMWIISSIVMLGIDISRIEIILICCMVAGLIFLLGKKLLIRSQTQNIGNKQQPIEENAD